MKMYSNDIFVVLSESDNAIVDLKSYFSRAGKGTKENHYYPCAPQMIDSYVKYVKSILAQSASQPLTSRSVRIQEILKYEVSVLEKIGSQGRRAPLRNLYPKLEEYFRSPFWVDYKTKYRADVAEYFKYYMYFGNPIMYPQIGPITDSRELYNTYTADRKATSGIYFMTDKRHKPVRQHAIKRAVNYPYSPDPTIFSTVNKKNSDRCVYMSTLDDQFRYNRLFYKIDEYTKPASHHIYKAQTEIDKDFELWFRKHPDYVAFEADYKSFDDDITRDHLKLLSYYYYKIGLISDELYYSHLKYWEATRSQIVITPDGHTREPHALLSGEPCTNRCETPLNLIVQISWLLVALEANYNPEYVFIKVNGDDVLILIDRKYYPNPIIPYDCWCEEFTKWCMEEFSFPAQTEKQNLRYAPSPVFFCKRWYHPNKHSTYIGIYALNSILYPEKANINDVTMEYIRIVSILDLIVDHPLYKFIVTLLLPIIPVVQVTPEDVSVYNSKYATWKNRVMGEDIDLSKSYTHNYLAKCR